MAVEPAGTAERTRRPSRGVGFDRAAEPDPVREQCLAARTLDRANPEYEVIRKDFKRFGFDPSVALTANPLTAAANQTHITHLGHLNHWRNYVAHGSRTPPPHGGPLSLAAVRTWRDSCDGLATELDRILYDYLVTVTGSAPW